MVAAIIVRIEKFAHANAQIRYLKLIENRPQLAD